MSRGALTDRQEVFIAEYLKCWNATEAVIRAGYRAGDRQRASEIGYQLLQKTPVLAEIERRKAELMMSADEVLIRLTEQARGIHGDYLQVSGAVDLAKLIADGKGHLVHNVKETRYGRNIEFYDAQAALVHIGRHHGLFTDRVEVTTWQDEVLRLLHEGAITLKDVENELGADIAKEFFKSVGQVTVGVGPAEDQGQE